MRKSLFVLLLATGSLLAQINLAQIPGTVLSAKYNVAGVDSSADKSY